MNTSKIGEIKKLYKQNFPMGWAAALSWNTDEESASSLRSVQEKVNKFEDDVFFLFAQSVLSGEYHDQSDFPSQLIALYEYLSNGELLDNEAINNLKTVAFRSFNDIVIELEKIIMSYRHLLTDLYNKYADRPTKYIVNAYRNIHRFRQSSLFENRYGGFYSILIDVAKIDHLLTYDKNTIMDLILSHSELVRGIKNQSLPEKNKLVLKILNEKCLFLLKKLLIEDNRELDFLVAFEHEHYDASNIKFEYFKDLDCDFEFYRTESYNNDPLGNELDRIARTDKLRIGQYALLMKYYKDSKNTSQMQIDNILKDFDAVHDDLCTKFKKRPLDRYALGTLKNYMYNCRFSFMMQKSNYSFDELKKDLDVITEIQYHTGILNFYPYRKAFKRALQFFHSDESTDKSVLTKYKNFLIYCISKLDESIQWCRAYCFYPVQKVYNECLVKVDGFGDVFVASSFCKPVSYKDLKEELNSYRNQALLVDNEIELLEEKAELEKIKADIDNSKTREVEILSFFVAIITFLFGAIGFFAKNENNDFMHLLSSIFGLGAILLIFVSGIHMVTMRKEDCVWDYFRHPRAWFCIGTILASVALLVLLIVNISRLPV